ncbi:MAG: 5'-methylthioadenosine phosphorylase, partial [Gammaproteobacteria bacterium]|nr:5'-methylthioadenosine phosphorylase [Gammaproteobacteria bacterium]
MTVIAVIGGTGSAQLNADVVKELPLAETPFGQPSGPVSECVFGQKDTSFLFLPRHGPVGGIPPHRVNYRANIWALHEQQPDYIVALNAVGGISDDAMPARLVIPEQLIDYTSGRAHTYFDGDLAPLEHIDF